MKYKVRQVIASLILVALLTVFTSIVIQKGIDAEFARQDAVLEEHWELWGGKWNEKQRISRI